MVDLRIEGLCIRLGEFALHDITFAVGAGEYFCVLGPTGAGKSVLVECAAGLHRPREGRIFLGEREVTPLGPERRGIGYVPQDYALFPNMSVRENIAFGLRVRRCSTDEVQRRVTALAGLLDIAHLLERHPLHLSGGEKQRAALARALAVQPQVLLLDEPLAAVDEMTRNRLCDALRDMQRATGVTVVHVSHSWEETLAVADRMGIMKEGRMMQVGTPDEILSAPRSRFVAEFTRAENVLPVTGAPQRESDGVVRVPLAEGEGIRAAAPGGSARVPALAVVRPEAVRIVPMPNGAGKAASGGEPVRNGHLSGTIVRITERGHLVHFQASTDAGVALTALKLRSEARALRLHVGDRVQLLVNPEDVHLL